MLSGFNVIIGVTGGIAAYKACEVVNALKKLEADVHVIMTKNAREFITPKTFEILSKNEVSTDMFAPYKFDVEHISLSKKADAFAVVPATANIIGKISGAIADDMLSTTLLAAKCPIIIAPAMNTAMYTNKIFTANLDKLREHGYKIVKPSKGMLVCGDIGEGRLADTDEIIKSIADALLPLQDYKQKKILITAGATAEKIDVIRSITNHSSGKMGLELAKSARKRGARVTLIMGSHTVQVPPYLNVIEVKTAEDMLKAVLKNLPANDIIIKAAAVGDYKIKDFKTQKIKDERPILELVKNPDIAFEVGKIKGGKKLIIFCAETENLKANAIKKLKAKNADLVVANDVTKEGAGFGCDTNIALIIDKKGEVLETNVISKSTLSNIVLDKILKL